MFSIMTLLAKLPIIIRLDVAKQTPSASPLSALICVCLLSLAHSVRKSEQELKSVYIFVGLVKRGVPTFVGKKRRCRNDPTNDVCMCVYVCVGVHSKECFPKSTQNQPCKGNKISNLISVFSGQICFQKAISCKATRTIDTLVRTGENKTKNKTKTKNKNKNKKHADSCPSSLTPRKNRYRYRQRRKGGDNQLSVVCKPGNGM